MGLDATRTDLYTEAFEILGNNKSEVELATLGVILRSLGLNPTHDEVAKLFDAHKQGSAINLDGVLKAAAEFEVTFKTKDHKAELREAFSVFDKDKSGKISAAELRHVIANIGSTIDEDEVEDMMKEADKDGDGLIDYNEFVAVVLKEQHIPPKVEIPAELLPYMNKAKGEKVVDVA